MAGLGMAGTAWRGEARLGEARQGKVFCIRRCPMADTLGLVLRTEQDCKDLLTDLRQAMKRSLRTGGAYQVVRRDGDAVVLNVTVWLNGRSHA